MRQYCYSIVLLCCAIVLFPCATRAQTPREQLTQLVAQLQASPGDDALRQQVIAAALAMNPAPAIPEEARRFLARGIAAFEIAKSADDFKLALPEFQKASNVAPWWPDTYFNLAKVQEKTGDLNGAIASYRFYLAAAPNADDAEAIRTQSYKLEFMAEQAAKSAGAAAQAEQHGRAIIDSLDGGQWVEDDPSEYFCEDEFIEIHKGELYFGWITMRSRTRNGDACGGELQHARYMSSSPISALDFTTEGASGSGHGKISENGESITIAWPSGNTDYYHRVHYPQTTIANRNYK